MEPEEIDRRPADKPLAGRTALVTGGARGIGRAICRALADDGANLVVNYLANDAAAGELVEELPLSAAVRVVRADVSDAAAVAGMMAEIQSAFGAVDIVVNNAGWTQPQFFLETTEADWDRMIDVHLKGAFLVTRAVVPAMIEQRRGVIINISSVVGRTGAMGAGVHYCAAKAGILGLTRALAHQLAPYGIRVNAVAPGMIDTPMIRWRTPEQLQQHLEAVPLRRVGEPAEIAAVVRFLCSDATAYITGETVDVNGGQYML